MAKKQTMDHAQLLVLSLLAGEDMYGYQMIVELARRSDHTFEMKEGTLYPVLHGLERDGAVEAYQQEAPTGRMRKYYRLTRKGREPAFRPPGGGGAAGGGCRLADLLRRGECGAPGLSGAGPGMIWTGGIIRTGCFRPCAV